MFNGKKSTSDNSFKREKNRVLKLSFHGNRSIDNCNDMQKKNK